MLVLDIKLILCDLHQSDWLFMLSIGYQYYQMEPLTGYFVRAWNLGYEK